MLILADPEALRRALRTDLAPELHHLIAQIVHHARATQTLDLTFVLVIEPHDTETAIIAELGFSPLCDPIDGIRYGDPAFIPYWAYLRQSGDWYELIHIVGTGYAYVLLIDAAAETELTAMCAHFTGEVRS